MARGRPWTYWFTKISQPASFLIWFIVRPLAPITMDTRVWGIKISASLSYKILIRAMNASAFLSKELDLIIRIFPSISGTATFSSIKMSSHPDDFTIWSRLENEQHPYSIYFCLMKTLKSKQMRSLLGEGDRLVEKLEGLSWVRNGRVITSRSRLRERFTSRALVLSALARLNLRGDLELSLLTLGNLLGASF